MAKYQQDSGKRVEDTLGLGVTEAVVENEQLVIRTMQATYLDGMAHEAPYFTNSSNQELAKAAQAVCAEVDSNAELFRRIACRPQLACSLFTDDAYIVVVQRSKEVAVASGNYHATIVGGAKPIDTADTSNFLVKAMRRQAKTELGLDALDFRILQLIGVYADTTRLNQPYFPMIGRCWLKLDELIKKAQGASDKWESAQLLGFSPDSPELLRLIDKMPLAGQVATRAAINLVKP